MYDRSQRSSRNDLVAWQAAFGHPGNRSDHVPRRGDPVCTGRFVGVLRARTPRAARQRGRGAGLRIGSGGAYYVCHTMVLTAHAMTATKKAASTPSWTTTSLSPSIRKFSTPGWTDMRRIARRKNSREVDDNG